VPTLRVYQGFDAIRAPMVLHPFEVIEIIAVRPPQTRELAS
jgi:hypothetical protein